MVNVPGFTFNGRHSSEFGITVLSHPVDVAHEPSYRELQLRNADGTIIQSAKRGPRQHPAINVMIPHEDYSAMISTYRSISAWLNVSLPKVLAFDRDPGVIYYAVIYRKIVAQNFILGEFPIHFYSPDPYAYNETLSEFNGLEVTNNGVPVPSLLEFEAASSGSGLEIGFPGGYRLMLEYSFASGDELVVDTQKRLILINGMDGREANSMFSSSFNDLLIPSGSHAITVYPEALLSVKSIKFREKYL